MAEEQEYDIEINGLQDFDLVTSVNFKEEDYELDEYVDILMSAYEYHVMDSIRRFKETERGLELVEQRLKEIQKENEELEKKIIN
ncbi:hypothetical protein ENUP19_0047G0204 [Entamoeba nuttalli]|uniref:Uncharacterized protein n=2 Tax=Entamoeba nuttalli TaxID=412467 RepID=K2G652_ENTNP|nr:hypothetical protein ENU1_182800 [Entamoeba nuttalli P19]EKE37886.1 hypothetical protein ENU1_182800 [Entamoeba nuttalli P19]|eukprot:XP_008859770.1 hypothetical protein ENU1_182800 [Entamoeba nuttalli P19]